MKKFFSLALILFVFCLGFTLCGTFVSPDRAKADVAETPLVFSQSNKEAFISFVQGYGEESTAEQKSAHQNANITLTSDIDLNGYVFKNTIGTEVLPFMGTFNGGGFKISNFTIDVFNDMTVQGAEIVQKQYAGLFGMTNGAVISNLDISGNVAIKVGGCVSAYAGAFVGRAYGTTFTNCQLTAENVTLNSDFSHNLTMGYFAGVMAGNSKIENVIVRSEKGAGKITLGKVTNKQIVFGGVAGEVDNAKLYLVVVSVPFDIDISQNYESVFSLGGVVGVVSQGASEIVNVACENSIAFVNHAPVSAEKPVSVGEVVGSISHNAPNPGNISHVHFKSSNLDIYGDQKYYIDGVNVARTTLVMTSQEYFDTLAWHAQHVWSFKSVWRFSNKKIYLQSFANDFRIRATTMKTNQIDVFSIDKTVVNGSEVENAETYNFRYNDRVEITFNFDDNSEGQSMVNFFTPDSIQLNGSNTIKLMINKNVSQDGKITYAFPDDDEDKRKLAEAYEIVTNDDAGKSFTLVIKSVNASTTGEYRVVARAKTYSAFFTTALFKGDNNEQYVEEKPGSVFHYAMGQGASETSDLTVDHMTYMGQQYRIATRAVTNSPNLSIGWYLMAGDKPSVDDTCITSEAILEFTFGEGVFTKDVVVYSKYVDDSYVFTFRIDDGIEKIELYGGDIVIEEANNAQQVAVSRNNSAFKVEIYVRKDYEFNPEDFMDENDYKSKDAENPFCVLREYYEMEDYDYYHFVLNLSTVNKVDFPNGVSIVAKTTEAKADNSNLIWIIVGSVAGGVVLGTIIFLIVFFGRRRGFGGSGKIKSYSKKDYKNMYF